MPTIEIDFESFKAITARRTSEETTEGDVVRELLGLDEARSAVGPLKLHNYWESEGVKFAIGMELLHTFRDGRVAKAQVTSKGLLVDEKIYNGLSPAGVAVAGYQLNGWRFWYLQNSKGRWVTADSLRGH